MIQRTSGGLALTRSRDSRSVATKRKAVVMSSDVGRLVAAGMGDRCGHSLLIASVFFSVKSEATHLRVRMGEEVLEV